MMDGLRARTLSAYFHFLMNNCYSFIEMTKKLQHFGTIGHFFIDTFATLICVIKSISKLFDAFTIWSNVNPTVLLIFYVFKCKTSDETNV